MSASKISKKLQADLQDLVSALERKKLVEEFVVMCTNIVDDLDIAEDQLDLDGVREELVIACHLAGKIDHKLAGENASLDDVSRLIYAVERMHLPKDEEDCDPNELVEARLNLQGALELIEFRKKYGSVNGPAVPLTQKTA